MSTDTGRAAGDPGPGRAAGDSGPELITNAAGKSMLPAKIEAKLIASSPLIGHAVCIGDHRPYNVALIVLDLDASAMFAARHGVRNVSAAKLAADEQLQDTIALAIDRANEQLSRVERIKRFAILPVAWEPGGDELTTTMKLNRKPIAVKYAKEIEWMYEGAGPEPA